MQYTTMEQDTVCLVACVLQVCVRHNTVSLSYLNSCNLWVFGYLNNPFCIVKYCVQFPKLYYIIEKSLIYTLKLLRKSDFQSSLKNLIIETLQPLKPDNECQHFSKYVTYLLSLYLSVIRIQFFRVPSICLLVCMHIIFNQIRLKQSNNIQLTFLENFIFFGFKTSQFKILRSNQNLFF